MGSRNQLFTCTLAAAFEQAQNDLEAIASDIRESADSMEETFPGAERTERYQEAAMTLEGVDLELEVPTAVAELSVSYSQDTRKGQPRATAISNLAFLVECVREAIEPDSEDEDVIGFANDLEAAHDELLGIEL